MKRNVNRLPKDMLTADPRWDAVRCHRGRPHVRKAPGATGSLAPGCFPGYGVSKEGNLASRASRTSDPETRMPASKWKRASLRHMRVEKRPGDDWCVEIWLASENKVYAVTVFGAADEQTAVSDALSSFSATNPGELKVTRVEKL